MSRDRQLTTNPVAKRRHGPGSDAGSATSGALVGTHAGAEEAAHLGVLPEALLNTEQVAAILGLAPATLANDRVTAEIGVPYVKVGGRVVRYRRSDLEEFIEARVVRPGKGREA